jgi:hypothetical protein
VLFDENTHRIIGCAIVGPNAVDLIAKAALAIEMGADAEDIGLTIHPHPRPGRRVHRFFDCRGFGLPPRVRHRGTVGQWIYETVVETRMVGCFGIFVAIRMK